MLHFAEEALKSGDLFVRIGGSACPLDKNAHIRDGSMAKLDDWLWPCHIRVMREDNEEFLRDVPQLESLLQAAREYRALNPMTDEERSAQARSFAYGNVALHNPGVTRAMVDEEGFSLLTLGEIAKLGRLLGGCD